MAQTDSTALAAIIPEVWADMAQARFLGAVRVAGSPAVMQDDTLEGAPGATINFPKWGALGELDDLVEGTPMTPAAMSASASSATIKEAGKAVEITDKAALTALGNAQDEAVRQFGILAARKVDAALIAQAQADETAQGGGTPLAVTLPEGKTTASYLDAIVPGMALFGDEWDPNEFAGIYINSAQHTELLADTNFIDAAKLGAASPMLSGQVGVIAGVPVIVTDRVPAKKLLFLKRNSLGLLYKRRPLVETDRDVLARSTIVTTTIHYAVKRLDDRGVGVVTLAES